MRRTILITVLVAALSLVVVGGAAAQQLSVKATGPGAVGVTPLAAVGLASPCSASGWCTYSYPDFATVTIVASRADSRATFARWLGDCAGSQPTCTLSMNVPHKVLARFGPVSLIVAESNGGSASVAPDPVGSCGSGQNGCYLFPYGTTVTLTAHPNQGFTFYAWSGWCNGFGETCTRTIFEPQATGPSFMQCSNGECTASTQQPLKDVRVTIKVYGSGSVKLLGRGTCRKPKCSAAFTDGEQLVAEAAATGRPFSWGGNRCHGRNRRCQFEAGFAPLDGRPPLIVANFG